jgi:formylglycine-generating enzyme required for sulfatase activity/dienelactone hydrolase
MSVTDRSSQRPSSKPAEDVSASADITSWFGELARRRVFQVIAVYVALAWGFTEIFTTVSETLSWPVWTRTAVVVLFILGFPAAMLFAWLFDVGPDGVRRARPDSRTGRLFIGSAIVAIIATTTVIVAQLEDDSTSQVAAVPAEMTRAQWAQEVAAPEIERLLGARQLVQAFRLAREALDVMPEDPRLQALTSEATAPFEVTSKPLGATVSVKSYDAPDDDWYELGITPFTGAPATELRWRVEKEGFATRTVGRQPWGLLHFELHREAAQPPGMVFVPGGAAVIYDESLHQGPAAEVADFWIDQFETTNAEYRAFVQSDAYASEELWQPLIAELGLEQAAPEVLASLVDTTGRRGPATWALSTFPEGKDNYPVQGISWLEAAAYCEFRGKVLPTVYHFSKAGQQEDLPERYFSGELLASNFGLESTHPMGTSTALGPFGTFDLMGNVAEWAWNADSVGRRYLSGASFVDPEYQATAVGEQIDPLQRSENAGVRCVSVADNQELDALRANVELQGQGDEIDLTPVNADVYAALRRQYDYDPMPLNPETKLEPQSRSDWRLEVVTIDTAYGERMDVQLYLPNDSQPPYQAVVFFPGGGAYMKTEVGSAGESSWIYFIPRTGRALVVPIYSGMYGRRAPYPDFESRAKVQLVIRWAQDLMRAMDYLETREDIDAEKIAYYGFSLGGTYAPVFTAVEQRFAASVLISGGTLFAPPEEQRPDNFAPYVSVPTLMIGGKNDPQSPVEIYQRPILEMLGTPPGDRKLYVFDGAHAPTDWDATVREIVAWLDRYLGPVK